MKLERLLVAMNVSRNPLVVVLVRPRWCALIACSIGQVPISILDNDELLSELPRLFKTEVGGRKRSFVSGIRDHLQVFADSIRIGCATCHFLSRLIQATRLPSVYQDRRTFYLLTFPPI